MTKRYADLFDYLDEVLCGQPCDGTLKHAQAFATAHGIYFGELSQTLEGMGGYCDCEVLMNAAERIPSDEVIGEREIMTPRRLAIENGYYCHCRVDGVPVPSEDAGAARKAGDAKVEFWVPCAESDPYAGPDINRASALLFSSSDS